MPRVSSPALVGLLLVALLAALPPGAAQDHDHAAASEGILLISDVPPDGRTVVGEITHFSYVILGDDGAPEPHHDVHVAVTLNGLPFYATESAHDYDGVGGLDIAFPVPGTYNVTVTVPGEPDRMAHFDGTVVAAPVPATADLVIDAPERATAGALVPFALKVVDADGAILPHTDALVEIRRVADDFPVLQVHTHTHEDPMTFQYAFESSGIYQLRTLGYTAFPTETTPTFPPVLDTRLIVVDGEAAPGAPAAPASPVADTPVPADSAPLRTEIMADPASGTSLRVGPFSQVRTSLVNYDETNGRLVQHTDHEATLTGPYGPVFTSKSLHEYDGVLEIMSANRMVGTYTWTMDVQKGDGTNQRTLSYEVLPAHAPAFGAGPQFIQVTGLDRLVAGTPGTVDLFVHGAGEVPFQHGEVAFRLDDGDGTPLVIHKLHTHATGTFAFQYSPPVTGAYTLQVDPFDIHGAPTPVYHGESVGAGRMLGFSVMSGTALSAGGEGESTSDTVAEQVPALPIVLPLLLGLGALMRMRRCTA